MYHMSYGQSFCDVFVVMILMFIEYVGYIRLVRLFIGLYDYYAAWIKHICSSVHVLLGTFL